MDTSKHRNEVGTPDDVQGQSNACARNEHARCLNMANEIERSTPGVGETIPDGATRQLLDTRESPCIV